MFAVIFIPNFSLQAVLRHEPESRARAVALVDPKLPKPILVQLTPAARACGVCEGLTPSQAMARCGELIIKPRSPAQEESATEILLQTAYAFSPGIEATAPGVCTIELKGLGFRFDDHALEPWAGKLAEVLAQFHLEAKVGLAATPELAWLAARAGNPVLALSISPEQETEEVVPAFPDENHGRTFESFPISALEPPSEILEILRRWGIQTIGELLALGKDNVAERLGPAVVELFNRVSPDSPRPLKLVAPAEEFAEQMEFENEVETVEPLLFALRRFVEQLSRRLELIYLVVAEFQLQLGLSSGLKYERVFKIPAPTGRIEILFRMLQTHLETVRTDSPIISLCLIAKPSQPESQQFGLFESTLRDPNQFAETLARLTALAGPDRAGTPESISGYKPDSFRMSVSGFRSHNEKTLLADGGTARHSARAAKSATNGTHGVTPPTIKGRSESDVGLRLRRFRPPLPSHIELRDGKPTLLRSHVFIGPITETRGPFYGSGNWWDVNKWAREEWDIETSDGSLFRIFRSSEGDFVEGVYD
ncbi:MAG TPA: DNA polymerase Y family protein [Verrucomicrobiae bacterium]|jgi:protein ImuB|nr:DNA polymerase Y family protein [Verrucomicrobiae bacterium]